MERYIINNKESSQWINKYTPLVKEDLIMFKLDCESGKMNSENLIYKIETWLNNFKKNKKLKKNVKINKRGKKKKEDIKIDDLLDNTDSNIWNDNEIFKDPDDDHNITHSSILVMGEHGVGKTCIIYSILNSNNYEIYTLNFSKIKTSDDIDDFINKFRNINTIQNLFEGKKNKKVFLIDDIHNINSRIELECIFRIIELNCIEWIYPMVLISGNKHNKFVNTIKKKVFTIKINPPDSINMFRLLLDISKKENLKYNKNDCNIVRANIVEYSQNDYRRLIQILQDLSTLLKKDNINDNNNLSITTELFEKYKDTSTQKDINYNLFKSTAKILFEYSNIEDILKIYDSDKVNIPLMIHQYYNKCVNLYSHNKNDVFKNSFLILDAITKGDIIENFIHGNQNWNLNDVRGYFSCVQPSFILEKNLKKVEYDSIKTVIETNNNKSAPVLKTHKILKRDFNLSNMEYPIDFNRTSIMKINEKGLNKISDMKDMDIEDYTYIHKFVSLSIQNNGYKLKNLYCLKDYDKDKVVDDIEKILKINKFNNNISNNDKFNSKIKKDISKLLN